MPGGSLRTQRAHPVAVTTSTDATTYVVDTGVLQSETMATLAALLSFVNRCDGMSASKRVLSRRLRGEVVGIDAVVNFAFMVKLKARRHGADEFLVDEFVRNYGAAFKPELAVWSAQPFLARGHTSALPEPAPRTIIFKHILKESLHWVFGLCESHVGSVRTAATPVCRRLSCQGLS